MELAELRRLLAEATPAPWAVHDGGRPDYSICHEHEDNMCTPLFERWGGYDGERDGNLIVAMRNALPAVLDVAEAAGSDAGDAPPYYWLEELAAFLKTQRMDSWADKVAELGEAVAALARLKEA